MLTQHFHVKDNLKKAAKRITCINKVLKSAVWFEKDKLFLRQICEKDQADQRKTFQKNKLSISYLKDKAKKLHGE